MTSGSTLQLDTEGEKSNPTGAVRQAIRDGASAELASDEIAAVEWASTTAIVAASRTSGADSGDFQYWPDFMEVRRL